MVVKKRKDWDLLVRTKEIVYRYNLFAALVPSEPNEYMTERMGLCQKRHYAEGVKNDCKDCEATRPNSFRLCWLKNVKESVR